MKTVLFRISVCLICGIFLFTGVSTSSAAPPSGGKFAVIVAIADYPGTANDLNYTDDDGYDLRDALISRAGFSSSNIYLLTDASATKSNVQSAITSWLDSREGVNDLVVVFFSGHGTTLADVSPYDEGDGYDEALVVYDDYVLDDELDTWLDSLESENILVAIDSCYSGGMIKGTDVSVKGIEGDKPLNGDLPAGDLVDGFAKDINVSGRIVLTASDDDQYSMESGVLQNGVFTYYLVQGLSLATDINSNQWYSMEEIYSYLRDRVDQFVLSNFPGENNGEGQDAQLYDGVVGDLDIAQTCFSLYLPIVSTPIEYIRNGGFEKGAADWTQYSSHGWDLILSSGDLPVSPHGGSWATWLGGEYDDISYVQQWVTVPSGLPYLYFWQWSASEDSCGYDYVYIMVNGSVAFWRDLCTDNNTGGWQRVALDFNSFEGQSTNLAIRVETDGSLNSNLWVDDFTFDVAASTAEVEEASDLIHTWQTGMPIVGESLSEKPESEPTERAPMRK